MDSQRKYEIKLLILGDQAVGKSSLMIRYTDEVFNLNIMGTAGIDLKKKNVVIDGEPIKVMIYDTAGHERFRQIAKTQYKGSKGIVLIYDVTDIKTFDRVSYWIDHIKENADTGVEILLVANKCDKNEERVVNYEDGANLALKFKVPFIETSAKTGENIDKAFLIIINNVFAKDKLKVNPINISGVIPEFPDDKRDKKKSSKCCN